MRWTVSIQRHGVKAQTLIALKSDLIAEIPEVNKKVTFHACPGSEC